MENPDNKDACRDDGKKCCCCWKAILIVLVFLLGGVIGYLKGMHCGPRMMGACMHQPMGMEAGHMLPAPQAKPK